MIPVQLFFDADTGTLSVVVPSPDGDGMVTLDVRQSAPPADNRARVSAARAAMVKAGEPADRRLLSSIHNSDEPTR